jgi:hypothetical protein
MHFGEQDKGIVVTSPGDEAGSPALQDLTSNCTPATFGRDNEDVLDESHRKANKLEMDESAITTGLINNQERSDQTYLLRKRIV